MDDPWHSLPEKASGTEVVIAAAQWWGQQNPSLCPSESTVPAEPNVIIVVISIAPEYKTITGDSGHSNL